MTGFTRSRGPKRSSIGPGGRTFKKGGSKGAPRRGGPSRSREGPRGRFPGRDRPRREVELTKVTCAACGADCHVPFKPKTSKPVYCKECFGKEDDKPRHKSPVNNTKDFDQINKKLDKIMEALGL